MSDIKDCKTQEERDEWLINGYKEEFAKILHKVSVQSVYHERVIQEKTFDVVAQLLAECTAAAVNEAHVCTTKKLLKKMGLTS